MAGPSDAFVDALYLWETSGTRDDLEAMQREVEALLDVWRVADAKFRVSHLADTPEAVREGAA